MKPPSVVELTVKQQQQQQNGCHQNCMKFKIRKNSLHWGKKTKVKTKVKTQRLILSGRLRGLVPYPGNSGLSKKVDNYHKLYTVFYG